MMFKLKLKLKLKLKIVLPSIFVFFCRYLRVSFNTNFVLLICHYVIFPYYWYSSSDQCTAFLQLTSPLLPSPHFASLPSCAPYSIILPHLPCSHPHFFSSHHPLTTRSHLPYPQSSSTHHSLPTILYLYSTTRYELSARWTLSVFWPVVLFPPGAPV